MRLLEYDDHGKLVIRTHPSSLLPKYAILSHTWSQEDDAEVLLRDVEAGINKHKSGWAKLEFCGQQARKHGLHHFWVDTCCIDKTSTSDVAKSITSMYAWYAGAEKCYVYLTDISPDLPGWSNVMVGHMVNSRWFTRGWTLQELLAPSCVEFYSRDGRLLGTKQSLSYVIQSITSISSAVLEAFDPAKVMPEEVLKWVYDRQTKEPEDKAYCLVGLLGVSLHPIYGEGLDHAMERLYEAIGKSTVNRLARSHWTAQAQVTIPPDEQEDSLASTYYEGTGTVDRAALLDSLRFAEMDSRKANIDKALHKTCHWLLSHPYWQQWIDDTPNSEPVSFLWIKGNAGVGKSTLVKFADDHILNQKHGEAAHICFYFNARGSLLQRTTDGMYRALIAQLMTALPHVLGEGEGLTRSSFAWEIEHGSWTTQRLEKLFIAIVAALGEHRLYCFIDALDECVEGDVERMIDVINDIVYEADETKRKIRICLASRHYPTIVIPDGGLELIVEQQEGHKDDIREFVQRRLKVGTGPRAITIKNKIVDKANHIFMWAVLVVPILNDTFKRAKMAAVETRLEELPPELGKLFGQILHRDDANRDELLLCLQWVLFAARPLSPAEFYVAMECRDPDAAEALADWDADNITEEDFTRRVRDCSKGLVEVTKSAQQGVVQFIHESVRDFLLGEEGLHDLWPDLTISIAARSHEVLKQCCMLYIRSARGSSFQHDRADESGDVLMTDSLMLSRAGQLRTALRSSPPFQAYATQYVCYHANEAAIAVEQAAFLTDFPLDIWRHLAESHLSLEAGHYPSDLTMMHVLAEFGYQRLAKSALSLSYPAWKRSQHHGLPLIVAHINGHQDIIRLLLTDISQQDTEALITTLHSLSSRRDNFALYEMNIFTIAHQCEHVPLLRMAMSNIRKYVDLRSSEAEEALCVAIAYNLERHAKVLINSSQPPFNLNLPPYSMFSTVPRLHRWLDEDILLEHPQWMRIVHTLYSEEAPDLLRAIDQEASEYEISRSFHLILRGSLKERNLIIFKETLSRRPDVRFTSQESLYDSLHNAISEGLSDFVAALLDHGLCVDHEFNDMTRPLTLAISNEQYAVVMCLLEHGPDLHKATSNGSTALHLICGSCRSQAAAQVAFRLISGGARLEAVNSLGETPLLVAAQGDTHHLMKVIHRLLGQGARREAQDDEGMTAFFHGCSRSWKRLQLEQVMYPGCVRHADKRGRTCLMLLSGRQSVTEVAEWLIASGADIHARDADGKSAATFAAWADNLDLMKVLLAHGARNSEEELKSLDPDARRVYEQARMLVSPAASNGDKTF